MPSTSPSAVTSSPSPVPTATADRGWRLLLINSLPGLLAGSHVANQLFFLNPDLPFGPTTLLRVAMVYGAIGGLISLLLLTPLTWGREGRARRLLPWALTVVLATIAVSDFVLASRYSFYLPPGINRRMIKAAVWLSLLSLIFFYTALLHTLHRRPYGIRSRTGLLLAAFASVYVMAERREAFKPFVGPAPLPSVIEPAQRPTLYVIGLGGAPGEFGKSDEMTVELQDAEARHHSQHRRQVQ